MLNFCVHFGMAVNTKEYFMKSFHPLLSNFHCIKQPLIIEPPCEKRGLRGFVLVPYKPGCTAIEDG